MNSIALTLPGLPVKAVRNSACFWAFALWFPVGLGYIALAMLCVSLLFSSELNERWEQVKSSSMLPAILFFAGWVLLSVLIHPKGGLAVTMVFHVALFVLTLLSGLMLFPEEARLAWKVFLMTSVVMLFLLLIHVSLHSLPNWPGIYNLLVYDGNKSIRAGLLIALTAAVLFSYFLWTSASYQAFFRQLIKGSLSYWLALVILLGASLTIIFYVPSRTSTMLLPLSIFVIYLHRKHQFSKALIAALVILLLSVSMYHLSKNTHVVIENGVTSLIADVESGHPSSSVGLRYHFYKFSLKQMLEHPLIGMGPGTWHAKWALLEPDYGWFANPHNDYLLFGCESGLPALLALFLIYALFFLKSFRIHSLWGSIATVTTFVAAVTSMFNAGMRDAVFCFSLVWLMTTAYSAAREDNK